MLTIVGWLWRDPDYAVQYKPAHANIWARMIHRNLTLPHRFVVFTDRPDAYFDPLITPIPLWSDWRDLKKDNWPTNCYVRLKVFSEEMRGILGDRFVSIDLDCV